MKKVATVGLVALILGAVWGISAILQNAMTMGGIVVTAALLGTGFVCMCLIDDEEEFWDD